ncbi:MAG: PKD domain-containing protein [Bacteroidales bacterium]|nr:PKD domain-containing protein [Bacteroidales bacterium]
MNYIFKIYFLLIIFLSLEFDISISQNKQCKHNNDRHNNLKKPEVIAYFESNNGNGEAIILSFDRNDPYIDSITFAIIEKQRTSLKQKGSKASLCNNLDFEAGNFTNWTGQTGDNDGYPAGSWVNGIVNGRHTIMNGGSDPYGGFPCVAPGGGTYSVRLGNDNVGAEAERLIYSFVVQPNDTNFIYKYAVVFEDPGHEWYEQPYFEMTVLDQNNQVIPCGLQHYTAASNLPGFFECGPDIWCKNWTTVGINLSNYVGQVVTIIATNADCSLTGHFGYAYIDFLCPSHFDIASGPYCSNQTSVTLDPQIQIDATFYWSTGQTTPTITINPNQYNGDTIFLYAEQATSVGLCGFWFLFPINVIQVNPDFSYTTNCLTVNFTDISTISSGSITGWNWNFGDGNTSTQQNPSHTYTNAGTYTVTLTVNTACGPASIVKHVNVNNLTAIVSTNNITCYGLSNGTATVNPQGTPPYTFQWNTTPAQYSQTATNLPPGTYTVTITDSQGCTTTQQVTITQPPELILTTSTTNAKCYGSTDGTATVSVSGGTPPYTYVWNTNPPQNNATAINLGYGTYTVTVTDANNCTKYANVNINQPTQLSSITVGYDALCYGSSDGYAYVFASGGTFPYSYLWNTNPPQTNDTATNLSMGVYYVTITDANNCTKTDFVQINQPPQLVISSINYQEPKCHGGNDGHAIAQAIGGTPPYLYLWNSTPPQTTQLAQNLSAGTYYVTVFDSHQCSVVGNVTITQPIPVTATHSTVNINCYGGNDGSATLFTSGGTPPYTYQWNTTPAQSGSQAVFLTAGQYTVTISDNNNCTITYTVTITEPPLLTATLTKTDEPCYGDSLGTIDVMAGGGSPPYTFLWNTGATSEDLDSLPAGIYLVTVTDSHGCTTFNGVEITQPSKLNVSINPSQYICIGMPAYLNLSGSGGTPPYTYYWNDEQSASTLVVFPDTTTVYSGYITDSHGCKTDYLYTTVYVAPPINVNLIANTSWVCPGEPVMLTPVIWGGVGPPYIIYNMEGDVVVPPIFIHPMESGYYWILVRDACGTEDTGYVYINVYPIPPVNIVADTLQGCAPLTVHFLEMSPDSGQSFVWDFGDNSNLSLGKNPTHTYTSGGVFDVSITVISQEGCKSYYTINDMITVWPQPLAYFKWEPNVINEVQNSVQFINMSQNSVLNIWSFGDGDSSSQVNPIHTYKKAGEYLVTLITTSNKGCKDTATAILKVNKIYTFYAPTAFTPDGDKVNDEFYVVAHGIKSEGFLLQIYDRWGEVIWSTDKFYPDLERSEKWDGKVKNNNIAPVGTYTWRAVFKDILNIEHEEVGPVSIIR